MNADQKKRAVELISEWNTQYPEYVGDRMAALLQELIDSPEAEPALVVEVEPDYWSRGHYYEGSKPHINPLKVWKLPVGTKLYTAPPVSDVEPVAYVTGYNNGYPTIAPINPALCMAIGTALYSAPPAPSVPPVRSTGQWESSRIADYNRGWNDCREATEKALNDLEKRK